MRVAVTGTPGTGKTTAVGHIATMAPDSRAAALETVDLTALVRGGAAADRDPDRDTVVADLDALDEQLADREDVLFESHLAHHLPTDRVIVLRCHPDELRGRLRERGEPAAAIAENAEAEALDVVLSEAVGRHGRENVYEIDTTDRAPDTVAREIVAAVAGERDPSAGTVDFTDEL
jgi:adenylate kinase